MDSWPQRGEVFLRRVANCKKRPQDSEADEIDSWFGVQWTFSATGSTLDLAIGSDIKLGPIQTDAPAQQWDGRRRILRRDISVGRGLLKVLNSGAPEPSACHVWSEV